jgi:membrane protease subunit HflK
MTSNDQIRGGQDMNDGMNDGMSAGVYQQEPPPGSSGPRRPRPGQPDMQQAWEQWKRQMSGLFGGGRRSGGGAARPGGVGINWGAVVVLVLAIWGATGFYVVDAPERGVELRFGRYVQTTEQGLHWHWPWPIESKYIVDVARNESIEHKTHMLTADENLVDITIAVQFLRSDPTDFLFRVRDPEDTLRDISESVIREVVGRGTLEAVLGPGRQGITERTKELIQSTLNNYQTGVEILTVNLTAVNVPDPVAPSQKDAIKAREDRDRYSQEAEAYANDILPRAQGSAARRMQEAEAYRARKSLEAEGEAARFSQLLAAYQKSPQVTRERLYLETVEEVLGNTRKVLLDTDSGGNVLYLPLDKLLEGRLDAGKASMTLPPAGARDGQSEGMVVDGGADSRARGSR